MMKIAYYDSPLGRMTMASDGQALRGLWFDGQKYDRAVLKEDAEEAQLPLFDEVRRWLDAYFAGENPKTVIPVCFEGSPFRVRVLQILQNIPYGETMTYGKIAEIIEAESGGDRVSAQAVGSAVGHNPISLIIPCHRVIGSDGSLKGYAGGLDRKKYLLELERKGEN